MTGHFLGLQPPRVPKWLLQALCWPWPANYTKFILGAQEMQFPHRAGVCGEQSSPRAVWLTEKSFHHLRLVVVQHFLVWDLSSFWSLWKWTSETGSHQPHRETLDLRTKARFSGVPLLFVPACYIFLTSWGLSRPRKPLLRKQMMSKLQNAWGELMSSLSSKTIHILSLEMGIGYCSPCQMHDLKMKSFQFRKFLKEKERIAQI